MTSPIDVDLSDYDTYTEGTPIDVFAHLRRESPVHWNRRKSGGPGFWSITRYADIVAVSQDTQRFTSTRGVPLSVMTAEEKPMEQMASDTMIIFMDPPRHTRLRSVINYAFTPKRIAALEPVVRGHAVRAIDQVIETGACNFYEVAATLPIGMISHLLGAPESMNAQILNWTNRTFGRDDPEFAAGPADTMAAYQEMFMYALRSCKERRKNPGDDILSAMALAQTSENAITDAELGWLFFLLLGAGNDTTRTLILNALHSFLKNPEIYAHLRANPQQIPVAIEEVLRLEPSVRGMGRKATEDVTIRGTTIRADDQVYMWYVSGNRDEEVFPSPDEFRLDRAPSPRHQSFGAGGPHFCVGAPLARLQTRIVFEEIFRRLPDLQLDGPITRSRSDGFVNSIKRLPVRFTPGRVEKRAA